MTDMQVKFTDMKTNLDDVKTKQGALVDTVKATASNMGDFKTEINDFLSKITGTSGMLTKLNCKWIKNSLENTMGAFCYGFAAPLWGFGLWMGCMGCMSCCIIPATYYLRERLGNEEVYKANMVMSFGTNCNKKYNQMAFNKLNQPIRGKAMQTPNTMPDADED